MNLAKTLEMYLKLQETRRLNTVDRVDIYSSGVDEICKKLVSLADSQIEAKRIAIEKENQRA